MNHFFKLLGRLIHQSLPARADQGDYLLCGRGCGSKFKNTAPLKRHEQVCTYTNVRATPYVATCPQVSSVKEEFRFHNDNVKNISMSEQPGPLRELNSTGGLRLKRSASLLEYTDMLGGDL